MGLRLDSKVHSIFCTLEKKIEKSQLTTIFVGRLRPEWYIKEEPLPMKVPNKKGNILLKNFSDLTFFLCLPYRKKTGGVRAHLH